MKVRSSIQALICSMLLLFLSCSEQSDSRDTRPNILFAIADDWSWPHAGIAGDPVVQTPAFDSIASHGVLFSNAYVSSPSCTPSRGAILTGQYHWRLQECSNQHGVLPKDAEVFPEILIRSGYHVGRAVKGLGPGRNTQHDLRRNPAGKGYNDLAHFLKYRPADKPFCFWFGSYDPHRPYEWQTGVKSGMKIEDVQVPACLPDNDVVRTDLCDYYWEIQRFDKDVAAMLSLLSEYGELDNTIVIVTSDNGMPFPRCKANLYDLGTRVPLAIQWGDRITSNRVVTDFVSLTDLAPTILEAAGIKPTEEMTGKSLMPVLLSTGSAPVDSTRQQVFFGRERHNADARSGVLGYPMRGIRTSDYLYIINFEPDRWPAGDPDVYLDVDNSPTKTYILDNRRNASLQGYFEKAFLKRPREELYDLKKDPAQMHNLASVGEYQIVRGELQARLMQELIKTQDPRAAGNVTVFDEYPRRH